MRRVGHVVSTLMIVGLLSACAMAVPSENTSRRELMVSQGRDTAYGRAQRAALSLGLTITQHADAAWLFTAARPTGESVVVTIKLNGLGCLVTFEGRPAHDVSDMVRAYQQQT